MTNIPKRIYTLEDEHGNRMNVPEDISAEQALEKITQGFDVTIYTYVLQPNRIVKRKDQDDNDFQARTAGGKDA